MIDRETVWSETYNRKTISVVGANVDVVNAINDYNGLYVVSRLEIRSEFAAGHITAQINLTADEMELLASHLLVAANYQRDLIKRVVADNAELMAEKPVAMAPWTMAA